MTRAGSHVGARAYAGRWRAGWAGLHPLERLLLLAVPLGAAAAALLLGQDINGDLRNYHLYNPYALLHGRLGFDLAPANLQGYFNPLIDLPYYWMIQWLPPMAASFLLALVQGLNYVLIFFICRCLLASLAISPAYAAFLALAGVCTVGFVSELGTTINDSLVSLFPLAALLMVMRSLGPGYSSARRLKVLALAGLLAGTGCALKPVIVPNVGALGLALFFLPLPWRERLILALASGAGAAAGMLLAGGWWHYLLWEQMGNPLFPQYNHIFHGELAQPLGMRDVRYLPDSWLEAVFYPIIFTLSPERAAEAPGYRQWGWLAAWCMVLVFAAIRLDRRWSGERRGTPLPAEARYLLAYFLLSFALWLKMFGIYRYLLPIEVLLPALLFMLAAVHWRGTVARGLTVLLLAALTLVNLPGTRFWGRAGWHDPLIRVEPPPGLLQASSIVMMGYPTGWLVPALDLPVPFIQGQPNFAVTQSYVDRAVALLGEGDSPAVIIHRPSSSEETVAAALAQAGYRRIDERCRDFGAWIGEQRFEHVYCPLERIAP